MQLIAVVHGAACTMSMLYSEWNNLFLSMPLLAFL